MPISWVCAEGTRFHELVCIVCLTQDEEDMWFSEKARLKAEAAFARRKSDGGEVAYDFRVYKGMEDVTSLSRVTKAVALRLRNRPRVRDST